MTACSKSFTDGEYMTEAFALQTSDPTVQQYTSASLAEAQQLLALVQTTPITSEELQQGAADLLQQVKAKAKALEERRTLITKPINEGLRSLNELFRAPKQALDDLERALKQKIAQYMADREAENRALLAQAAAAASAEQASEVIATLSPVVAPQGISVRYVWVAQIENPDAVPREFCSPDPSKIKTYVAGLPAGTTPSVSGVKFTREPAVASRGR